MAFDPNLGNATSRIRLFIGDAADPPAMPGGETTYGVLAAEAGGDEGVFALLAAARLRAHLATQPSSLSSGGEGLTWANRMKHLDDILSGAVAYSVTPPTATGLDAVAMFVTVAGRRGR